MAWLRSTSKRRSGGSCAVFLFFFIRPSLSPWGGSHHANRPNERPKAPRLYIGGIIGGDCHHRDPDRPAVASHPSGARIGAAVAVQQQPQAVGAGDAPVPRPVAKVSLHARRMESLERRSLRRLYGVLANAAIY